MPKKNSIKFGGEDYDASFKSGINFTWRVILTFLQGYILVGLFLFIGYLLDSSAEKLEMGANWAWVWMSNISSGLGIVIFLIYSYFGIRVIIKSGNSLT